MASTIATYPMYYYRTILTNKLGSTCIPRDLLQYTPIANKLESSFSYNVTIMLICENIATAVRSYFQVFQLVSECCINLWKIRSLEVQVIKK